ncbi:MAG: T9SS type A sorting domain-containing protein, partial [Bacteroidetes bacterium]|nr:T9SS type A sorting domain-containing protein [Bacteroidota bacterium]
GTTSHAQHYGYRTDALAAGTHAFRLRQIDTDGTAQLSEVVSVTLGLASRTTLMPPTPHPARGTTTLQFGLRGGGPATLHLYNVVGQHVATLYDGILPAETLQTVRLDTQKLTTGVYFVRLVGDRDIQTRRLVIVR